MRILFIGDIVGQLGRKILTSKIGQLKQQYQPNLIIVNGENAAHGRGITEKIYKEMMSMGVHCVTLGNHAYGQRELYEFIDGSNIVRPVNYPENNPGQGYKIINFNGQQLAIVNLEGRALMNNNINCPFMTMDHLLENELKNLSHIFVDFHAETTSEKIAMSRYLSSRVSVVVGTHTHVQTNDAKILLNHTAYITDVGMTGFRDGVIGVEDEGIIYRFRTNMPTKHIYPTEGYAEINGVFVELDSKGSAVKIETIHEEEKF